MGRYSGTGITERAGNTHGFPKPPRHLPTLPAGRGASSTGGVAALNHRLMAATPAGVKTKPITG
ncbi:MAG: hypothetical protein ACJ8FY_05205 [Gemmataceae bacterium]